MATQKRAEVPRRVLLHAAAEVFTRHGYADTKLSEILAQALATKGALYFHYGSKEELARAVIEEGTQRFTLVCTPYLDSRTPALGHDRHLIRHGRRRPQRRGDGGNISSHHRDG
jgi:AcrR family transcriptional regulator